MSKTFDRAKTFDVGYEESDDLIRDILLLVDEDISLEVIATWSEMQKNVVCIWAGKLFYKASDNTGIRVPDRPSFLPPKKEVADG